MKSNVSTSHEAVTEILPWYANGTISAEERAVVDRHLHDCSDCREELEFLREVGTAAAELKTSIPEVPDALGKTFALIDQWEAEKPVTGRQRVASWFAALWTPGPQLARSLLVAQLALIVVLGGMLFRARQFGPEYTTLSGGIEHADGVLLSVIFQPDTTEERLRSALRGIDATVVSGPSLSGVYVVKLSVKDAATVDAAIQKLRASPSVVRFVERQP